MFGFIQEIMRSPHDLMISWFIVTVHVRLDFRRSLATWGEREREREGGGGLVLPYIRYIGMDFESLWSYISYICMFRPVWFLSRFGLKTGIDFE